MNLTFYIAAIVAVVATVLVITRLNAIHALLYLIVALLAVALIFYVIGAPLVAALEVILYAGAIMVLFVFVVMMLGGVLPPPEFERTWRRPGGLLGPGLLGVVLLLEFLYVLVRGGGGRTGPAAISPAGLGQALFGPYVVAVELASLLLLAGLIAAYHLGRPDRAPQGKEDRHGDGTR